MTLSGPGEWVGLHLTLGPLDLSQQRYAALACRGLSQSNEFLSACLRAGLQEGGFSDVFFKRHMLLPAQPADHLDTLHLPSNPKLPLEATWYELVVFLPRHSCSLSLHDMRLFFI